MTEHILGDAYQDEDYIIRCTVENLDGTDAVQGDFDTITLTTKNLTTGVQAVGVSLTIASVITDAAEFNFQHTISHDAEGLYTDTVVFVMQDGTTRKEVFQTHIIGTND